MSQQNELQQQQLTMQADASTHAALMQLAIAKVTGEQFTRKYKNRRTMGKKT